MKIYIVSDTHTKVNFIIGEILNNQDADYIIHLGDLIEDAMIIEESTGLSVIKVKGNNDYCNEENDKIINIGGHRLFITHGHTHDVYYGLNSLVEVSKINSCDIALYGHTHIGNYIKIDGVTLINPGSLYYSRGSDKRLSYAILNIYNNNEIQCDFIYQN